MSKNIKSFSNREGYNIWSSFYDQYPNPTVATDELNFPPVWRHLFQRHILEIGCGTGRHTVKLLSQKNKVVGVDLSKGMLDVARKKLDCKNLILWEADFMACETFKDDTFDA